MTSSTGTDTEATLSIEHLAHTGPRRAWSTFRNLPSAPPRRARTDLPTPHRPRPGISLSQAKAPSLRTMPLMKKKLCEFCQFTIITTDQKWGMHHSKYATLRDSAHNGCTLCVQLYEDIGISRIDPESLAWPLYRWNIRNPQRDGHMEEVFAAIVFRQAVSLRSRVRTQDDIITDLPERTFFLFQQSGTTSPSLQQSRTHICK